MVALLMGSKSDLMKVTPAEETLAEMGVRVKTAVISAHRQPEKLREFVTAVSREGVEVFIAAAGKSAALPGVVASMTTLPVIGLPMSSQDLGGMDALLSMVQMPRGVPVATVAIDGAENAALLACEILALKHAAVAKALAVYRERLAEG